MKSLSLLNQELTSLLTQLRISSWKVLTSLALAFLGVTPHIALAQQTIPSPKPVGQDEILIESDRQSTDNNAGVFTAYGNVKIIYPKKGIIATSRQLQYLKEEGIVVLTGDVDLTRQGRESLSGQRVVYFLEDDRLIADSDSGSQVLLNLFFDTGKHHDGSSSL